MKTKLLLLFAAIMALTSLSSCVDPYYAGGYGYGYSRSYYRPSYYGGYSRYSPGYRSPSYGHGYHGYHGYSGHHGGYGGHHSGGGFGGHHHH